MFCKECNNSLQIQKKYMKKAKDWGNWDMMENDGSRYSKSKKHHSIDRAMNELSRSKLLLSNFNKELRDQETSFLTKF